MVKQLKTMSGYDCLNKWVFSFWNDIARCSCFCLRIWWLSDLSLTFHFFNVSWKNRKFLPFVLTSAVVHVVIILLTCELRIIFVAYMKLRIIRLYQLDKTNISVDLNEDNKESAFCSDSNFSQCDLRTLNILYVLETGLCSLVYMS